MTSRAGDAKGNWKKEKKENKSAMVVVLMGVGHAGEKGLCKAHMKRKGVSLSHHMRDKIITVNKDKFKAGTGQLIGANANIR